jgi:hypothetical protein
MEKNVEECFRLLKPNSNEDNKESYLYFWEIILIIIFGKLIQR